MFDDQLAVWSWRLFSSLVVPFDVRPIHAWSVSRFVAALASGLRMAIRGGCGSRALSKMTHEPKMFTDRRAHRVRIPTPERVGNRQVFVVDVEGAVTGALIIRFFPGGEMGARDDGVGVQRLIESGEPLVAGQLQEDTMKGHIIGSEARKVDCAVFAQTPAQRLREPDEPVPIGIVAVLERLPGRVLFDHFANFEYLVDVAGGETGDIGATARAELDQPFGRQSAEGLLYRRRRDIELFGQVTDMQPITRPDAPLDNLGADGVKHLIGEIDSLGHRHDYDSRRNMHAIGIPDTKSEI
jgi:hypothetical protein